MGIGRLVGEDFGTYQVLEEIGRGGMAVVHKAYDPVQRRYVALKVLPHYFQHDPQFLERFHREGQAARALRHPNIVRVLDTGEIGGLHYLAMEYADGGSVGDLLARKGAPLDLQYAVDIACQVGAALEYAHGHGILHRDIKPSNILLTTSGRVLLSDFGIAKVLGQSTLTGTGEVKGTPVYMAPEQARGQRDLDSRADVYALGVVLYQMLTGRVPFEGDTPLVVLRAVLDDPPLPPRSFNQSLPPGVEGVILRALEKDRRQRFQRVGEMVAALHAVMYHLYAQEGGEPLTIRERVPFNLQGKMRSKESGHRRTLFPPWLLVFTGALIALAAVFAILVAFGGPVPTLTPTEQVWATSATARATATASEWVATVVTAPPPPPSSTGGQSYPTASTTEPITVVVTATSPPPTSPTGTAEPITVAVIAASPPPTSPTGTAEPLRSPVLTSTETPVSTNTPTSTPKPTPRPTPATQAGDVRIAGTDGRHMVFVPAGSFQMGATDAQIDAILAHCNPSGNSKDCERDRYFDEQPQHTVMLDAFWIDQREVTNTEYRQCVRAGACSDVDIRYLYDEARANHPVVTVTWGDAMAYCKWAGKRLPTEAEWEKAARGTDQRVYPWGNDHAPGRLNYCDLSCPAGWRDWGFDDGYRETAPVGSFRAGASPYGALDMAGNVWEWTSDLFHSQYYLVSPAENPQGPERGDHGEYGVDRVIRGGSWYVGYAWAATTFRFNLHPGWRGHYQGFRCVASKVP